MRVQIDLIGFDSPFLSDPIEDKSHDGDSEPPLDLQVDFAAVWAPFDSADMNIRSKGWADCSVDTAISKIQSALHGNVSCLREEGHKSGDGKPSTQCSWRHS